MASKPVNIRTTVQTWKDIEPIELNGASDYHELRSRAYALLQSAVLLNMSIIGALEDMRNVNDRDDYYKRKRLQLDALSKMTSTLNVILKSSEVDAETAKLMAELERKLSKIELELKRGGD